jgi:hypothetical protein
MSVFALHTLVDNKATGGMEVDFLGQLLNKDPETAVENRPDAFRPYYSHAQNITSVTLILVTSIVLFNLLL